MGINHLWTHHCTGGTLLWVPARGCVCIQNISHSFSKKKLLCPSKTLSQSLACWKHCHSPWKATLYICVCVDVQLFYLHTPFLTIVYCMAWLRPWTELTSFISHPSKRWHKMMSLLTETQRWNNFSIHPNDAESASHHIASYVRRGMLRRKLTPGPSLPLTLKFSPHGEGFALSSGICIHDENNWLSEMGHLWKHYFLYWLPKN